MRLKRVPLLVATLVTGFAASLAMPAAALADSGSAGSGPAGSARAAAGNSCTVGAYAPSGGGDTYAPITGVGRVVCTDRTYDGGWLYVDIVRDDGVAVATSSYSFGPSPTAERTVSAPCESAFGGYYTRTSATVPGANVLPETRTSDWVYISCGPSGIPDICRINPRACQAPPPVAPLVGRTD